MKLKNVKEREHEEGKKSAMRGKMKEKKWIDKKKI